MQQRWMLIVIYLCSCFSAVAQPWRIEGLEIEHLNSKTQLLIKEVDFAGEHFRNIKYKCPKSIQIYPQHECNHAQLSADWQDKKWDIQLDSQFDFLQDSGHLNAYLFERQLGATYALKQDDIKLQLAKLQLHSLSDWLPDVVNDALTGQFDGELNFNIETMKLSASALQFSAVEGAYGNDLFVSQLSGNAALDVAITAPSFKWAVNVKQGEGLFGPVYVNFSQFPLQINGEMRLDGTDGWALNVKILQPENMQIELLAKLNEKGDLTQAEMNLDVINAAYVNQHLLSAVLDLYGFKQSEMDGQFQVKIDFDGSQVTQADLLFKEFYFNNSLRKLSASDLNGHIAWHHVNQKVSQISWVELLLAGMPVDTSSASFQFFSDKFMMLGQPEWPVFDGSIVIEQWHMSELFTEFDMAIAAEIKPISLSLVTEKMGWPMMKGSLSGKIPAVIKKGPVISLDGGLDLNVFEGKMKVNQMSTERLFGVAPVIAGDVSFTELNLGQLTETFDFGRITGLLSGQVDDLRITNWKADRLTAEIHTVKKKGVKQTISQQAIDHISSIGGIQGALSRTFLRFFDDFKYKKIKLSCLLRNAVCEFGGINNTAKQFTIVEGGGIPKINIVGFARHVDWDTFISRLLNANYDG